LQTTNVDYNRGIEISATNGALFNSWLLLDMLQPARIDYLTFTVRTALGWDCEHANAVIEDPRDDSIIVSMRHQDAVVKFFRTGQLKWILGPHGTGLLSFSPTSCLRSAALSNGISAPALLIPPCPMLSTTPARWNTRSMRARCKSPRSGNTAGPTVTLCTDRVGNADWLPQTGNILITFGCVNLENGVHSSPASPNATMVRIKEVTYGQSPEVVFDLAAFDYTNTSYLYLGTLVYRSHRIPDLYTHPVLPITDLTMQFIQRTPHLQFSGDVTETYLVQASADLTLWEDLGPADFTGSGNFDFSDDDRASYYQTRYYRVLTQ
jgi:hypothetical protein